MTPSKTTISKMETSSRFLIHTWTKPCRALYGKVGVYTVYDAQSKLCLYIGQSVDLGKRLRRFFNTRFEDRFLEKKKPHFVFTDASGKKTLHQPVYIEVTTINNAFHLSKFERTMIAIKTPVYNKLLNYDRISSAT